MKHLFIIFFLILLSKIVSAQKIHFTDTSNIWKEFHCYSNYKYIYEVYQYIGDVTIDTVSYRKFDFGSSFNATSTLIREDSILNKVFVRDRYNSNTQSDTDVVLMDYNLKTGDTFILTNEYKYAVVSLDSVLIDNTWHKKWVFTPNLVAHSGPFFNSVVIEGIGCIQHPLNMISGAGCVECPLFYMYCFSNEGKTPPVTPAQPYYNNFSIPYTFDNRVSCDTFPRLNIGIISKRYDDIKIYPNPATTLITISSSIVIKDIIINNLIGQTVYHQEQNSDKVQIDISFLQKGLYSMKVNGILTQMFTKD